MAARREATGESEMHANDTDVFYIVEGSAVLTTGGTLVGEKTIGPGEVRGSGLTGGKEQTVSKGDVIVIPRGVPHWFKTISQAPMLYFVVKTVSASAQMGH
jgi:quercetin dioxygenase-like cupin family protein